jgi:hypothetical protein
MNKVTITITGDTAEIKVQTGTLISSEKWERTSSGAKCLTASLEENNSIPEELVSELSFLSMLGIMHTLNDLNKS